MGSGIKFVTPFQRHSGGAIVICRESSEAYEKARQVHPKTLEPFHSLLAPTGRGGINKSPEANQSNQALPFIQAA